MGKFIIDLPEEIHNKLRHKSVDEKKEMKEIIIEGIKGILIKSKTRKISIPKGESTIVFQLRFWNPAHYKGRKLEGYKSNKSRYNYYDGVIRLQALGKQDHFHSAGSMLKKIEEFYKEYVNLKIK